MTDKKIEDLLKFCLEYNPCRFVYSVTDQYFQKGTLSDKQIEVLKKIADEVPSMNVELVREC